MADIKKEQTGQTMTAVKKFQEDTVSQILSKINTFKESGELRLPKDYSPENALKSAWLILQETTDKNGKPVLETCSKVSIANALLKMVTLGLSPMKKQCDFIAYGDKLYCDMEYAGNIALAKRYAGLKWIKGNAIFEGDEFEFEVNGQTGRRRVVKHSQTLDNLGETKLKGAYAVYELQDGTIDTEVMNMKQIQTAWNQGAMKGNSPAHKNFPDQMAIKTVISRACKLLIRGSDDSILMLSDENEDAYKPDAKETTIKQEISQNANKQVISIDADELEDVQHEEIKNTVNKTSTKDELFADEPNF